MRINKDKGITQHNLENKKRYLPYIIIGAVIFISLFSIAKHLHITTDIKEEGLLQAILNVRKKEQIFAYLKKVQPLEDEFYEIVNNHILFHKEKLDKEQEQAVFYENTIPRLEYILIEIIQIDINPYVSENYYLFMDEINLIRDIVAEERLELERGDGTSEEKSKKELEKYILVSQMRRENLKKLFDKYHILYIDMGNKIKYKIK
ncbi:MAG: hypothetical protein AB2421_11720 [Thermotaleaceae bacterium]